MLIIQRPYMILKKKTTFNLRNNYDCCILRCVSSLASANTNSDHNNSYNLLGGEFFKENLNTTTITMGFFERDHLNPEYAEQL